MNDIDNIENYLEYSVDNIEYLEIIKGLRSPLEIISIESLLEYMSEQNEKYCSNNDS